MPRAAIFQTQVGSFWLLSRICGSIPMNSWPRSAGDRQGGASGVNFGYGMGLPRHHPTGATPDAPEDYPQPGPSPQVLRLRPRHDERLGGRPHHRGPHRAQGQQPTDLLRLRAEAARLRPAARAEAIPVRAPLGHRRGLRLCDATGRLPEVRRDGRAGALGRGQEPPDDHLPVVPGPLGQAAGLEGGGRGVPHHLGERLPLGQARRPVGPGPPRASMASRPSASTRCSGARATST